jgi:hypothetical protein
VNSAVYGATDCWTALYGSVVVVAPALAFLEPGPEREQQPIAGLDWLGDRRLHRDVPRVGALAAHDHAQRLAALDVGIVAQPSRGALHLRRTGIVDDVELLRRDWREQQAGERAADSECEPLHVLSPPKCPALRDPGE